MLKPSEDKPEPHGYQCNYLRRLSCRVLIWVWDLSSACIESLLRIHITVRPSLHGHITFPVEDGHRHTDTHSVLQQQRKWCNFAVDGGEQSYWVVGRVHCVLLLSWLTKKVLPRLSSRSSQPEGRAGSSWLCLGPDMSWDSRNSQPGCSTWTESVKRRHKQEGDNILMLAMKKNLATKKDFQTTRTFPEDWSFELYYVNNSWAYFKKAKDTLWDKYALMDFMLRQDLHNIGRSSY